MNCTVVDCTGSHYGRGFCRAHWMRWRRHGDPTAGTTSPGVAQAALIAGLAIETDDCIVWRLSTNNYGYGQVRMDGRPMLTHIVACTRAHGPKPTPDHEVAHSCNNPPCYNARHLRWATRTENMADKIGHGTQQWGERSHRSKLTAAAVLAIRERSDEGSAVLAAEFGVSPTAIRHVLARRTWANGPHPLAATAA